MTQAPGNSEFSTQDAAAILTQASTQARRQFQPFPPWLTLIRAGIALAGYGTIWLSVRGQHPYTGPTTAAITTVIILAVANLAATVTVARRASAGISGRTPLRPAEITTAAAAWTAVFAVMAALAGAGASRAVYLGWYPAAMPLIAAGLTWAAITARRGDKIQAGTALAVAAVGAASIPAGPAGAWAAAAVGLCAVLTAKAAILTSRQRAATTRP